MSTPKRAIIDKPCMCEHFSHDEGNDHGFLAVPASKYEARYVGHVCAHCATTHMAEYLLPYPREGRSFARAQTAQEKARDQIVSLAEHWHEVTDFLEETT